MEKVDRLTRVNALMKREIADCLESCSSMMPTGVLVSITEVSCSVDLRNATVGFSVLGGDDAAPMRVLRALNKQRIDLQGKVARDLQFKHTPKLRFELDNRMAEADKIIRMIDEVNEGEQ